MTTSPHTIIGQEQTIDKAKKMMGELGIRHLPVLDGGKIVGLISDRDVHLVESLSGANPLEVKIKGAMSLDPYLTSPDTPLDEVVSEMASHKYGSAIVVQNEKVVGIFTAVDALKTLAGLLHTRLAK
ncbi:MAG: CBS domain-containing protein [Deltaproteobacteria bacterium]|nr:CBS domain-containing protein [Deltaproteobacteria bacterium]